MTREHHVFGASSLVGEYVHSFLYLYTSIGYLSLQNGRREGHCLPRRGADSNQER